MKYKYEKYAEKLYDIKNELDNLVSDIEEDLKEFDKGNKNMNLPENKNEEINLLSLWALAKNAYKEI